MPAEKRTKIIGVALGVCLACSILVSTAAVVLSSRQAENRKLEKIKNILQAGNLWENGQDLRGIYDRYIRAVIIDLETGEALPPEKYTDKLNVESFDIKALANDPRYGKSIPANRDLGQIKRMPRYMAVYFVGEGDEVKDVILPITGKGLWSTMYGFIALDRDLRTISGLTFYEHGETPGLGGEVDNPVWKGGWRGKKAFDEKGEIKIEVLKGRVDPGREQASYQVDGLSGSTLTTRGVDQMVKFWLGDDGYGPLIRRLRKELADGHV